jgi:hypothetical protein
MTLRQGTIASVVLVLLAGLVIGGETRRQEVVLSAPQPVASAAPASQPQPQASDDLDLEKLHRSKRAEPIVDVFAYKTAPAPLPVVLRTPPPSPPPPPAEPAAAPPPPTAPALPFRFVARFVENGATRLLLANGDKEHTVAGGETLEGTYRVDSVSEQAVTFTYLPMNTAQTLTLLPETPR